ncbi:FMN phosphatase YigB (HAD superfamily) [Bradyrhizobium sp. LM3.2]
MSDLTAVKALVFDVFGTVVDWRTSLITDFMWWAKGRGIAADWTALVDGWRGMYMASMDDVRKHPERGYVMLDDLHRRSLEKPWSSNFRSRAWPRPISIISPRAGTACIRGPTASRA